MSFNSLFSENGVLIFSFISN